MPAEHGRWVECPTCLHKRAVRAGQEWSARYPISFRVRIISAEQDGVIVEQVGREQVEPRWGISYANLQRDYVRTPSPAGPVKEGPE